MPEQPTIESVVFRDDTPAELRWLGPGKRTVVATFTDGRTAELLSYYGDEHVFSEGTFAGLTEVEARSRFHAHDVTYLQS